MNWTIEMIEKAREIYQARHGGDYFENGEIIKKVVAALRDAAEHNKNNCVPVNGVHALFCTGHEADAEAFHSVIEMVNPNNPHWRKTPSR